MKSRNHRADRRNFARRPTPIKPAINDCCKVSGIIWMPPAAPRSKRSRVTSSTKSGTAPAALSQAFDHSFGSA